MGENGWEHNSVKPALIKVIQDSILDSDCIFSSFVLS